MSKCRACFAPSDVYLCGRCVTELRDMLAGLPKWVEHLVEAATGQTRMGDSGRHNRYTSRFPIRGDDIVWRYVSVFPKDADERPDDVDRKSRADAALRAVLSAGSVNGQASDLCTDVHTCLAGWVEVFGGDNHQETQQLIQWLRKQVNTVAVRPESGRFVMDVKRMVRRIESVINRRVPWRFLGPCPTLLDEGMCGVELRVRGDAVYVSCPSCGEVFNCNHLQRMLIDDMQGELVPLGKLLQMNRYLPAKYRVSERTLRHWRSVGKLTPAAHGDDGEPLYTWRSVKELQTTR